MQRKEYRTIFHNPNKKEEMEKLWIRLLTEIYAPKGKEILDSQKKKGEGRISR